jgi:hypothetical protein
MDPVDHFNTQAKEGIPTALTLKENVNYSAVSTFEIMYSKSFKFISLF